MENLNLIAVITDENFGLPKKDLVNPYKRYGARGIIYREDGKVALLYKAKMNEYKLPGGGIDEGETPIKAGCILKNIIPLGYNEEKKGKTDFYQKSYVFIGEVLEDTGVVNFTEKEIAEGAQIVWVTMEEALELVGSSLNNVLDSPIDEDESAYATRFVVYRDRLIIDYYINNFKK